MTFNQQIWFMLKWRISYLFFNDNPVTTEQVEIPLFSAIQNFIIFYFAGINKWRKPKADTQNIL